MNNPTHNHPKAVIFGCARTSLSAEEKSFFSKTNPLGFILFARNCETPEQVKQLVSDLRQSIGRADAPVLIDQEGGRVQRLGPPYWRKIPSARALVEAVEAHNPERLTEAVQLNAHLIAHDLSQLGITVDCLPVLDIPQPEAHDIISDRAFGDDPAQTARLGRAVCEGLLQGGVLPVIKHIPGHGRSIADSHLELGVVSTSREILEKTDFAPFHSLSDMPWAMTAHLIYSAFDPDQPATHSETIVQDLIRKSFGFSGVLLSDDVSMEALSGSIGERAAKALKAGCDVVLHCNGKIDEMIEIAGHTGPLSEEAAARILKGETLRRTSQSSDAFNAEDALARLSELAGGHI